MAPGQHVHVQMKYALARIRTRVDYEPVSARGHILRVRKPARHGDHVVQQARFGVAKLLNRNDVPYGHDQDMSRCNGVTVTKRKDRLVSVQ